MSCSGTRNYRGIDLADSTNGRGDARSSAPHAILDLLHGVVCRMFGPRVIKLITALARYTVVQSFV
jgi:hypothetical protein